MVVCRQLIGPFVMADRRLCASSWAVQLHEGLSRSFDCLPTQFFVNRGKAGANTSDHSSVSSTIRQFELVWNWVQIMLDLGMKGIMRSRI